MNTSFEFTPQATEDMDAEMGRGRLSPPRRALLVREAFETRPV
jgi:hypothetical protein